MSFSYTYHKLALLLCISMSWLSFCSCDDGAVEEKLQPSTSTDTYTICFRANIQGLNTWSGQYTVALACFAPDNDYAEIQKTLHGSDDDEKGDSIILSGVSASASTVEIAIVSPLRKRIATLFSFTLPDVCQTEDTVFVDAGIINASMFSSINRCVFQDNNCSRCHSGSTPAAELNLSPDVAYTNLVNVRSYKSPSSLRVQPGNADSSYLYRIITDENIDSHYAHPGLFTDAPQQAFIEIIKSWINAGAK